MPQFLAIGRQRQSSRFVRAQRCFSNLAVLYIALEKLKQPGKLLFETSQAVRLETFTFFGDELTDVRRDDELGMLLRRKGGEAMGGFKVLVPVLVFRLED